MGIGTSLGAYFETELDHHAGNEVMTLDNNELSPNAIMPQTPEPVDPSHYDTALTPDQESKFQDWKGKMAPNDSGQDYDLRGAFLNNVTPDKETGHWPDTFKKPNHPTFSDQSMYAGERPDLAGKWAGDKYLPPGKITEIANITNTPGEILEGLEGTRVFGSGYGVPGPTQMRRPANSNNNLQIDDPVMDKSIGDSWSRMVRGQQIVADRQTLTNTQSERPLNDIEKARLNKLDKEHEKHFGGFYPD